MGLNDRQAFVTRVLSDGRVLDVFPLTLGRARLTISESLTTPFILDGW